MARPGDFRADIGTGSYHNPGPIKVTGLRYRFKQPPGTEDQLAILLSRWPSAPDLSSLYPSFLSLSSLSTLSSVSGTSRPLQDADGGARRHGRRGDARGRGRGRRRRPLQECRELAAKRQLDLRPTDHRGIPLRLS